MFYYSNISDNAPPIHAHNPFGPIGCYIYDNVGTNFNYFLLWVVTTRFEYGIRENVTNIISLDIRKAGLNWSLEVAFANYIWMYL